VKTLLFLSAHLSQRLCLWMAWRWCISINMSNL